MPTFAGIAQTFQAKVLWAICHYNCCRSVCPLVCASCCFSLQPFFLAPSIPPICLFAFLPVSPNESSSSADRSFTHSFPDLSEKISLFERKKLTCPIHRGSPPGMASPNRGRIKIPAVVHDWSTPDCRDLRERSWFCARPIEKAIDRDGLLL